MTLDQLNRLPDADARAAFERCCGASRWVDAMCAGRPYRDTTSLLAAAAPCCSWLAHVAVLANLARSAFTSPMRG